MTGGGVLRFAILLGLVVTLALPVRAPAQDSVPPGDVIGQMAEQLMTRALREIFGDLAPTLQELQRLMGEVDNYGPPRLLPNGDILIPRRPEAPRLVPDPGTPETAL